MTKKPQKNNDELEKVSQERDSNLAGWKRSLADFENFKKQFEKEKEMLIHFLKADALMKLMPIMDNWEKAMKNAVGLSFVVLFAGLGSFMPTSMPPTVQNFTFAAAVPGRDYVVICKDGGAGEYEAFPDVCRLLDGRLMCVFYAAYDHVGLPNERWPKGGGIDYVFSGDEGKTWTSPRTS